MTGALGLLGTEARLTLGERGIPHTGVDHGDLDLLDEDAVFRAMAGHDVVLNCAAWTAVDDAESREAEAFATNATAAGVLARAAHHHGARIVQVSTDYVFAGDARTPYDEDATPAPRTAYGRTKAAGEQAVREAAPEGHHVVRTAWLYGAHGPCFPRTITDRARASGEVDVVDDQVGQPTWTRDLAELLVRLVESDAPAGTWHATSSGETTWAGFAREIVDSAGLAPDVVRPVRSDVFPRPASRPSYSVLGNARLVQHGIEPIGPWQQRWAVAASEVLGLD